MTAIGKPPFSQRLRMRALRTGDSLARIGADDHEGVGLVDARDRGIENIACAAELPDRASRRPAGNRVDMTPRLCIRSCSANMSSTAQRSPAIAPIRLGGAALILAAMAAKAAGQVAGAQLAVLAQKRPVEALGLQAIDDLAGLVGNPFLVHGVIDARQDAHDLAAARVDADRRAERVHDVDRLGS